MNITEEQVDIFLKIKDTFLSKTKIPGKNNWKSKTNNDIWEHIITQVIVVGRASPGDKFKKSEKLKKEISYDYLLNLTDEEIREKIHETLRLVNVRFVGDDVYKCKKTKALVNNFGILKSYQDGPMGLIGMLSEFQGANSDKKKIDYLKNNFCYLKDKGARDFLMELGLIENAIALDSRVKGILGKCGITIKGKTYDEIETDVLDRICKPIGLSGVQFDRLIFQNYTEINKIYLK
jgi:hypothetical protein